MNAADKRSFGTLLRHHRQAAGLTQEELAERAELSVRQLAYLEQDRHSPRPGTIRRLGQALELSEEDRGRLLEAALDDGSEPVPSLTPRDNLPLPPTPFIGREREVAAITDLLRQEDVRLLTLTGPGGAGKTRLAIEAARRVRDTFPDGILFVSLGALTDPELVASAVAAVLGVREIAGRHLAEALRASLQEKRLLLLLDNFEHLLPAAPLVGDLLASCPALTVLVTSRTALHLTAEHSYAVPALALPDPTHLPALGRLIQYDAIALFLDRARAARAGFALTVEDAPAIAEVCRRLDGLPLAIELAAARVRVFPPRALARQLSQRPGLLAEGPRDAPARQRTLWHTIDWSHALLSSDEQSLFARLSVFAGGCTLDAVEQVCNAEGDLGLDTVEGITSLVDQSLLQQRESATAEPRFAMLETIREYAAGRLHECGEAEATRGRHADYFLAFATRLQTGLLEHQQAAVLEQLEPEHDNLRAALRWALDRRDGNLALRLAAALWGFWFLRGYLSEGRANVDAALTLAGSDLTARASVLMGAGLLHESRTHHAESLALYRQLGDRPGIAAALNRLGWQVLIEGDTAAATTCFEESLTLERELEGADAVVGSLHALGVAIERQGGHERAAALLKQAIAMYRRADNKAGLARALNQLGDVAYRQGDIARAARLNAEALAQAQELGSEKLMICPLADLGKVAAVQGDHGRAASLCVQALTLARDMGEVYEIVLVLQSLAAIASATGWAQWAGRLWGAAGALRTTHGIWLSPASEEEYDRLLAPARIQLGDAQWQDACEEGKSMPFERVVEEVLHRDGPFTRDPVAGVGYKPDDHRL